MLWKIGMCSDLVVYFWLIISIHRD